jgi:hypothetical protein
MSSETIGVSSTLAFHGWATGQRLRRNISHVDRCNHRAAPSSQGPEDDEDEAVV